VPGRYIRRGIPIGGFNNSMPADGLQEGESPNLLNVRFRFNEIRPGPGRASLAPAVASPIQVIARFSVDDTTKWIIMITDQYFYKWGVNAPGDVQQWTQVGGVTLTGYGRWDWTTGEDCFFFARADGGGVYRWKGGAALIDMVPNVPFTDARFVEYFNNRLCVGNVAEAGKSWANRVRYPVNGDHTNWSGNGSGFIDLYEPEQEPIQGMKVLNNRLTILREHSLTDLVATGTITPAVFNLEQRTSNVGTIYPYTIDCNGIMLFFVGNDGNVWGWNGTQLQSIGDKIYKSIENIVDPVGGRQIYFGKIYPYQNEYWLWLGGPYVYVYDFLQDRWMIDYFPNIAAIGDAEFYVTPNNWGNTQGSWGSWGMTTWQAMSSKATSRLVVGLTDMTTITVGKDIQGYYTGELIDCFVETKDYDTNESVSQLGLQVPMGPMMQRTCERLLLVYMYNNDASAFELGASGDRGRSWTTFLVTPNMTGFGLADWKITGNVIRFRIRQTSATPVFRWQGLVEEFYPGGPYLALDQPPGYKP
jgi:hypothetical protein